MLKQIFFDFLKKERVYYKWRYEVIRSQNNGFPTKKIKNPEEYIGCAFYWPEKDMAFWNELHKKWIDVINAHRQSRNK